MAELHRDILTWFHRLLPGNPIFLRVLHGGGRRMRHLLIRLGYLSLLFLVMLIGLMVVVPSATAALDDLARSATQVFRFVMIVQLAMICFVAPIFASAAISQEKDSQTYNILLATPLSNAQIVLGSLLSRLFFVLVLLLASVPILSVTMVYGGVTFRQIALSTGVAATTAILTASLAIAISVSRVGTRRTIFSFYLAIAIYLLAVGAVGYPRSFRRSMESLQQEERRRAVLEWVAEGHARPSPGGLHQLLTANPDSIEKAAGAVVPDREACGTLVDKLRQADETAVQRSDTSLTFFGCPRAPLSAEDRRMSWLAPFHPLLALQVALNEVEPPTVAVGWGRVMDSLLGRPHFGYMGVTFVVSMLIVLASMLQVRRGARDGERGPLRQWVYDRIAALSPRRVRRRPRNVWRNPVAWREARTRASFTGRGLSRHVIILLGIAAGAVLLGIRIAGWGGLTPSEVQDWLAGLILVETVLILLMAASSAATAVTLEHESGTMELLLCTPLTSGYLLYGKLRGLVSFLFPMTLVPALTLMAFGLYGMTGSAETKGIHPESGLCLLVMLVGYSALASIQGLAMSVRFGKTVSAVLASVGITFLIVASLGGCGFAVMSVAGVLGALLAPLSPLTGVMVLVRPDWALDISRHGEWAQQVRVMAPVGIAICTLCYALLGYGTYRNIVLTFDMTLRKRSA